MMAALSMPNRSGLFFHLGRLGLSVTVAESAPQSRRMDEGPARDDSLPIVNSQVLTLQSVASPSERG